MLSFLMRIGISWFNLNEIAVPVLGTACRAPTVRHIRMQALRTA